MKTRIVILFVLLLSAFVSLGVSVTHVEIDGTQTLTNKTINLKGYAVASLPRTCNEGDQARITDGDATGAVVQCDASNTWRCEAEYSHAFIDPACPPYNATVAASDSSTAIQAAIDRAELSVPTGNSSRMTIKFRDDYTVTSGLVFNAGASTTANLHFVGTGNSGLICNYSGSTPCLTVKGDAVINHAYFEGFKMRGGTSRPDELLRLTSLAQATIRSSNFSDAQIYGIRTTLAQHLVISDSHLYNNNKGSAGCFIYISNEDSRVRIVNNAFEGKVGSLTHLICLGGNSIEALVVSGNAHFADEIAGFIRLLQDTTILGGIVANNSILNINAKAFDMATGTGTRQFKLSGNTFTALAGATHGFEISNWIDSEASGNTFEGFGFGARIIGASARYQFKDNIIDADTACFVQGNGSGAYSDTEIDGNSCAGATTSVMIALATSNGNNRVAGWMLADPTVRALGRKWDFTGGMDAATDSLQFADGVQSETCPDGGLSLTPYYKQINLDVTGSSCPIILNEVAVNGQYIDIVVARASGTTANIADDGSIANLSGAWTGALGDVLSLLYTNAGSIAYWVERSNSDNSP